MVPFLICVSRLSLSYCLLFLVVSCWGNGLPLGSLVCDVSSFFVTFPYGVLGQVWYLIYLLIDFSKYLHPISIIGLPSEKIYL